MVTSSSWIIQTQKVSLPEIAEEAVDSSLASVIGSLLNSYMREGDRSLGFKGNVSQLLPLFTANMVMNTVCTVSYGALRFCGYDLGKIGPVPVANLTSLFAPRYILAQLITTALRTVSPRYLVALNVAAFALPFFFPKPAKAQEEVLSSNTEKMIEQACKQAKNQHGVSSFDLLVERILPFDIELLTEIELKALKAALLKTEPAKQENMHENPGEIKTKIALELDYYLACSKLPKEGKEEFIKNVKALVEEEKFSQLDYSQLVVTMSGEKLYACFKTKLFEDGLEGRVNELISTTDNNSGIIIDDFSNNNPKGWLIRFEKLSHEQLDVIRTKLVKYASDGPRKAIDAHFQLEICLKKLPADKAAKMKEKVSEADKLLSQTEWQDAKDAEATFNKIHEILAKIDCDDDKMALILKLLQLQPQHPELMELLEKKLLVGRTLNSAGGTNTAAATLAQLFSAQFEIQYGKRFSYQQWMIGNVAIVALSLIPGVKLVANRE